MGICFGDFPPSATVPHVCTQIVDGGAGAESSAHTGAAPTPNEPDPSTVRCRVPMMLSFFLGVVTMAIGGGRYLAHMYVGALHM